MPCSKHSGARVAVIGLRPSPVLRAIRGKPLLSEDVKSILCLQKFVDYLARLSLESWPLWCVFGETSANPAGVSVRVSHRTSGSLIQASLSEFAGSVSVLIMPVGDEVASSSGMSPVGEANLSRMNGSMETTYFRGLPVIEVQDPECGLRKGFLRPRLLLFVLSFPL